MYLGPVKGQFVNSELSNFQFFGIGPKTPPNRLKFIPKPSQIRPDFSMFSNIFDVFIFSNISIKIQPSQYFALHAYDGTQITSFKAHREVIIHHVY